MIGHFIFVLSPLPNILFHYYYIIITSIMVIGFVLRGLLAKFLERQVAIKEIFFWLGLAIILYMFVFRFIFFLRLGV